MISDVEHHFVHLCLVFMLPGYNYLFLCLSDPQTVSSIGVDMVSFVFASPETKMNK